MTVPVLACAWNSSVNHLGESHAAYRKSADMASAANNRYSATYAWAGSFLLLSAVPDLPRH